MALRTETTADATGRSSAADVADVVRIVLELVQRRLPGSVVWVAQFDHDDDTLRMLDVAGNASFGLRPSQEVPLQTSFCHVMASGGARLVHDAAADAAYAVLDTRIALDVRSFLGVPLEVGAGTRIGSICAFSREAAAYGDDDLLLLESMASLISAELERARRAASLERLNELLRHQAAATARRLAEQERLYERERELRVEHQLLFDQLQQALLPELVDPAVVEAYYRAGDDRLLLGGDFYDVARVDGDVLVVVGDVSGHGPTAARVAAGLRLAWRSLTVTGTDLAQVPVGMQTVFGAERHDPDLFATAALGRLSADGTFRFVLAGHPPPVVRGRSATRFLQRPPDLPLGVDPRATFTVHRERLAADDEVLLYTDGLVEARTGGDVPRLVGLEGLLALLPTTSTPIADVVRTVLAGGGPFADDVAALVVRPGG